MNLVFTTDSKHDDNVLKLTLSKQGSQFQIAMQIINPKKADNLTKQIRGYARIYYWDTAGDPKIDVNYIANTDIINLSGNISKGLDLLQSHHIISQALYEKICASIEAKAMLKNCEDSFESLANNHASKTSPSSETQRYATIIKSQSIFGSEMNKTLPPTPFLSDSTLKVKK